MTGTLTVVAAEVPEVANVPPALDEPWSTGVEALAARDAVELGDEPDVAAAPDVLDVPWTTTAPAPDTVDGAGAELVTAALVVASPGAVNGTEVPEVLGVLCRTAPPAAEPLGAACATEVPALDTSDVPEPLDAPEEPAVDDVPEVLGAADVPEPVAAPTDVLDVTDVFDAA